MISCPKRKKTSCDSDPESFDLLETEQGGVKTLTENEIYQLWGCNWVEMDQTHIWWNLNENVQISIDILLLLFPCSWMPRHITLFQFCVPLVDWHSGDGRVCKNFHYCLWTQHPSWALPLWLSPSGMPTTSDWSHVNTLASQASTCCIAFLHGRD